MIKICVKCGNGAEVGNFCKSCFLTKNKLFEINDFRIVLCTNQDTYYLREWKKFSNIKNMIEDFILNEIEKNGKIKKIRISFRPFKDGYKVHVYAEGSINGVGKKEDKEIQMSVRKKQCDDCTKLSGRYHEAKIQVRGETPDKILDKIKHILPNTCWIEGNRYGFDVFFINKSDASEIAKQLKTKYEVKKSFKVVGSKKGKMLMRDFYSIR